ncbi:hypothetical protein LSUB1_G000166 [Lachnellula subtilissima]|uniref:DUF924-domain-containing protein n=1 Tax=Lachnellula subtilissima TaxID=602034 RepID=A0A8H8UI41_9HELO|nr:hypothetical protein LSUB1_G000166 [Lachnellula subtilissima]
MVKLYSISSGIQKVLSFQAALKSTARFPNFRAISSASTTHPDINRITSYWFGGDDLRKKWFNGGPQVDSEIRANFGDLVEKAQQPQGSLALIVLLDQFPRNIFRGSPLSYSSDAMALKVASTAVAKGFDRNVTHLQQPIFYLPFFHDENMVSQVAAASLNDGLLSRCAPGSRDAEYVETSRGFFRSHSDCILRFGRFPSRNEALGRKSTAEEVEYLKEHPSGF